MYGKYHNIAIRGIETVVPQTRICNKEHLEYIEHLGERKLHKQIKLTGIDSCYVAKEESTEEMCTEAAKRLMKRLGWSASEIKGLILVTQTPSAVMPSTAFLIQKRLDISDDCIVFDVNLGCSGYTSGLTIVGGLLSNLPEGSKMLLLVGDTVTKCLKEDDYQNKMMFGDAGTATGVEAVRSQKLIYMQKSLGQQYDKIYMKDYNDYFHMDGMEVFRYTINQVAGYVKEFMKKSNLTDDDIDYYVFHQAQKHIVDNVAEFAEINPNKILISYAKYGNTAGASIPVTITENYDLVSKSRRLLMCGFGVGLSCGIVYGEIAIK